VKKVRFYAVPILALAASFAGWAQAPRPRLVVQITVDQLRGDLPLRYQERFGEGGFNRFLTEGTWYASAHHPHAYTETIVGHTALATGAYPSRHGMVANRWYDRDTGAFINNIQDPNFPILAFPAESVQTGNAPSTSSDKRKKGGASPRTILTTTSGDELSITTAGRAKVFGVSIKDRGAVSMAGHTGKAFWFSTDNGCFVTSTFYYAVYPPWVKAWCDAHPADAYKNTTWNLLYDRPTYLYRDLNNVYPADTPPETNMALLQEVYRFGRTFPHNLGEQKTGLYNSLTITPFGDTLTLDFAKRLVREERLGKDDVPDYLAISFSVTDMMAHWFSPASLESEDNLLRLDETLADLLAFLDKEVGLDKTLIVLSGDHGGPEYPEYLQTLKVNSHRVEAKTILATAQTAVNARFGKGIILEYTHPYFYLDRRLMAQKGIDRATVERVLANAIEQLPAVKVAIASSNMGGDSAADAELTAQIRRNFDPNRSGDVYVVQEPQWQIYGESHPKREPADPTLPASPPPPILLEHEAPWAYDTYVPVAFLGMGVSKGMVFRDIHTVDVAPTISARLRTKFPSGCVGVPLQEIMSLK
jgi:predicted AlkP superfamily pyrophosphatase or phosphodiesterase